MKLASAACVVAVALLAHAPALDGTYTYDDHEIIENNPRLVVRSASDLVALAGSNYWGAAAERSGERLFRPVPLLSYALERAAMGAPNAGVARAVNVLLHALCALVACALFASVTKDERAGLVGALIFAAHPLHAEAVAGIVGRAELLALGFGLGALLLHGRGTVPASIGAAVLFLLALGSKESAVAILPIAVVRAVLERRDRRRRLVALSALGVALAVYVGLRAWAIDALIAKAGARTLGDMDGLHRALVALAVYRDAWTATLVPVLGTAAHHAFPRTSAPSLVAAVLIQVACLLVVFALKRSGPRGRAICLGVIGFELALLPVSNLLVPIGVVYAERLLYAPTAWAALAIGALVPRHPTARASVAILAGALAFGSARNDRAWRDDLSLWRATRSRYPDEARVQEVLGGLYLSPGPGHNLARAIPLLESAAASYRSANHPQEAKVSALLARAIRRADRARSEELLRRATKVAPMNGEVWMTIAGVRLDEGDNRAALDAAERASALAPERADALLLVGLAQLRSGDARGAIETFTRALPRAPRPGEVLVNRAEARWAAGDREGALDDYRAAAKALRDDFWQRVLIEALAKAGKRDEARERWAPIRARQPLEVQATFDALLGL